VAVCTRTTLALRCIECGKLGFHDISAFQLGRKGRIEFRCSCGALVLRAQMNGWRTVRLGIPCPLCETPHLVELRGRELWSAESERLLCPRTGFEIGYAGSAEQVRKLACEPNLDGLAGDPALEDYFVNPDVMYEVLNRLHGLVGDGRLSCPCGIGAVEVDVFPDRIELRCTACGRRRVLLASCAADVKAVEVDELTLDGGRGERGGTSRGPRP